MPRAPFALALALAVAPIAACNLSNPIRFLPDSSAGSPCPIIYTATAAAVVDDECTFGRCSADFMQSGCELKISWGRGCAMLPEQGVVDSNGGVMFAASTGTGVCTGVSPPPDRSSGAPAFRMSCAAGCRVDLYAPPFASIASVQSIRVSDAPPIFGIDLLDPLRGLAALRGYISGAALLGERIGVVSSGSRIWDPSCNSEVPLELIFYDRTTMLERERVSAPDCLSRLTPTLRGDGFFALFGSPQRRIGFFDAHGALVRSASVSFPGGTQRVFDAVALVLTRDGTKLCAGYHEELDNNGYLASFNATDLSRGPTAKFQGGLRALSETDEGLIAASSVDSGVINFIEPSTLEIRASIVLLTPRSIQHTRPGALTLHRPSSHLIVSSSSEETPAVHVLSKTLPQSAAYYYEDTATPWAGAEWPLDRSLAVFGVTRVSDRMGAARIARFDPNAARFLPGSVSVGLGVVQEIFEDAGGDLWIVLPWSAVIARVRPEPR
jgi:hypothetical protein